MAETNISRRRLLAATGGALMGGSMGKSVAATLDWTIAKPSEAGFSDDLNARLDKAIAVCRKAAEFDPKLALGPAEGIGG